MGRNMTSRRDFLALWAGTALATSLPSRAQDLERRAYRVGVLGLPSADAYASRIQALKAGLQEFGYLEGRNVVLEYRWADGDVSQLDSLAAQLVSREVDVIVTSATPAVQAAKRATGSIPIIMATTADAAATGLVKSLSHPGGNVTGMTMMANDLGRKQMEILRETIPRLSHVGLLALSGVDGSKSLIASLSPVARDMKIELVIAAFSGSNDLKDAFRLLKSKRAQALIVQSSPVARQVRSAIIHLAGDQLLPTISSYSDFADAGGLISYGPNDLEMWRRTAYFVDRVLKGTRPADIPVEQPTIFYLSLNRRVAGTLRVKFPQALLVRADRVID
jgi:putative ABC transport system substrate-binding protein